MTLDPGIIQIDRLIIHNIPQPPHKKETRPPLKVTDVESDLTQEDRAFFSEKIQHSLNRCSYQAAFDTSLDSPVPKFIYEILNKNSPENDKFVSLSQSIAGYLYQSQTANNPSGLLVIIKLKYDNKPALAILKLEKEEGMQYKEIDDQGLTIYEVQQIHDLMLTGGKVFKIGLFIQGGNSIESIDGFISDKQSGVKSDTEIAKFFLEKFLGCYLLSSPEITTKQFYKASKDFINLQIEDQKKKIKYGMSLLSVINNNEDTINPEDFAHSHFALEDKQKFITYISERGVPKNTFKKNISSIKKSIEYMYLSLGEHFSLSVPVSEDPESLGPIKVESINEHKVRITIEAELSKFGK
jgi:hypothetical protein